MSETIVSKILALKSLTVAELQKFYSQLYDVHKVDIRNKAYLWRKVAYRLQELEYGGLSGDFQNEIKKQIQDFDPIRDRNKAAETQKPETGKKPKSLRDKRLPIPGTILTKNYKGTMFQIKVLEKSFEFESRTYPTLSAVAKEITSQHWNGFKFFNLG